MTIIELVLVWLAGCLPGSEASSFCSCISSASPPSRGRGGGVFPCSPMIPHPFFPLLPTRNMMTAETQELKSEACREKLTARQNDCLKCKINVNKSNHSVPPGWKWCFLFFPVAVDVSTMRYCHHLRDVFPRHRNIVSLVLYIAQLTSHFHDTTHCFLWIR